MRKLMACLVALVAMAGAANATPFTVTSPTSGGALPAGVTEIGGIVVDMIGTNGTRVVSQLPASSLFVGFAGGNPLTIGTQTGFTPAVLAALGGGIAQMSVRITLEDGDTGVGDFDEDDNFLRLNGIEVGNFSDVVTQQTNGTGTSGGALNLAGGFRNNTLDTGFFYITNAGQLASIYTSLSTGSLVFSLNDTRVVGDNFYDFTQGVDGGLINVGQGPTIAAVPEPISMVVFGGLIVGGAGVALRRRMTKKAA